MFGGKGREEEAAAFRTSLRGRLNAALFASGDGAYGQAAADTNVELIARCRDLRVKSLHSPEVDGWVRKMGKKVPYADFEPTADAVRDGASFAGFEDWGAVDQTELDAVLRDACADAVVEEPVFANQPPDLVVVGLLTWARPLTRGIAGFDRVANFLRDQSAFKRLDSIRVEDAVSSLMAGGHWDGLNEETRNGFCHEVHLQAWDTGVLIGAWNALGRLPALP